jgi:hypothetical protein
MKPFDFSIKDNETVWYITMLHNTRIRIYLFTKKKLA